MTMGLDLTGSRPVAEKTSTCSLATAVIERPAKVAVPSAAVVTVTGPAIVPPPSTATVTSMPAWATGSPLAVCSLTTGAEGNVAPLATVAGGWVVSANAAAPSTVKLTLTVGELVALGLRTVTNAVYVPGGRLV